MGSVLSIISVNKNFDGTVALDDFSLDVRKNTITGIIGPNGAGKTTLFNVVTGFLPADSGRVIYNGKHLDGLKPYLITRLGMARTFQQLRLITKLSVLDNIMLSFPNQSGERITQIFISPRRIKEQEKKNHEKALGYLRYMGIEDKAHALVEDLSYGQQKMVSLACCLASGADLLLLDEPVAGINPETIDNILWSLRNYRKMGRRLS